MSRWLCVSVRRLATFRVLVSERSGQPYDEAKAFAITPASTARRLKNLQNQAKALNLTLVPT